MERQIKLEISEGQKAAYRIEVNKRDIAEETIAYEDIRIGRLRMPTGQIRKALSGFYYVYDNDQLMQCRGRGVLRNRGESPLVGDFVDYTVEGNNNGTIACDS